MNKNKQYDDKFLMSELRRFKSENGRNPKQRDMQSKFAYPSFVTYINHFGSWNTALLAAGLNINKMSDRLNGDETCDNCRELKPDNQGWYYKNEQRLCMLCNQNLNNHKNGGLKSKSAVGFAFISQRVVAKVLELDLKYDCNCSQGFDSAYDLYDKNGYESINVKAAILNNKNSWKFGFKNKYTPDTYIMLGFSADKSNIEHVWITEPEDDLTFDKKNFKLKQSICITNSERGLKRAAPWEVDCKLYNDVYHSMSLDNCSVLRSD